MPTNPQLDESCESRRTMAADIAYEMAYGLSHELNNPLANIAGRARLLAEQETDPERRLQLAIIVDQAMRGCEMIADLMLFARPPAWNPEPVDLRLLVVDLCDRAQKAAGAEAISISHCIDATLTSTEIQADPVAIVEAVWAIVRNAIEAAQIAIEVQLTCDENWVTLTITDDGPGLSEKAQSLAFHPYFSGREAGRGLGLGLSKASRVLTLCGGSITLSNVTPNGCQVTMFFPRFPASQ